MAEKAEEFSLEKPGLHSVFDQEMSSGSISRKEKFANLLKTSPCLFPLLLHYLMPFDFGWPGLAKYIQTRSDQILYHTVILSLVLIRQPLWGRGPNFELAILAYYLAVVLGTGAFNYWYDYYAPETITGQLSGGLASSTVGLAVLNTVYLRATLVLRSRIQGDGGYYFVNNILGFLVPIGIVYAFFPGLRSPADWAALQRRNVLRGTEIAAPGEHLVIFDSWWTIVMLNAAASAILPCMKSRWFPWQFLVPRVDNAWRFDVVPEIL